MSERWPRVQFAEILRSNLRPYELGPEEDANLVGMRLYGGGPFHRELKPAMRIAKKSHFVIRSGDVIYNKLFAWKGTFGIVPPELDGMFVSDKFPTYTLDRERVDERYLRWYFRVPELWEQARAMSTGSAALSKLTLNPPKFLLLTIPLPPLDEQQRIVARIEELVAKVEEARALRRGAVEEGKALERSALAAAIPTDVPVEPLGNLIAADSSLSYGVLVPGPDVEDGVPFVRVQDLRVKDPAPRPSKRISPSVESSYARTRLRGNEILIAVVGATIGKVGVAPPSWSGANIARAVCRIVPNDCVDRDYLVQVLMSPAAQDYFSEVTRTLAQPTLNVGQLAQTPIPLPAVTEQRQIVSRLVELQAKLDTLRTTQTQTGAEIDTLLPAILDKAFRGEL